jgi:hypothetical protein
MAGKGSQRRPSSISDAELAANWERVFGKPASKARKGLGDKRGKNKPTKGNE